MLALFLALILFASPSAFGLSTTNSPTEYKLTNESGESINPKSVLRVGNELFFLGPDCLWWCAGKKKTADADILVLKKIDPPCKNELTIPWQEFNDFTYLPTRKSLVVLDKSGDLFEYILDSQTNKHWHVLRANINKFGQPDPDYVSLCAMNDSILLLDPERNQIWQLETNKLSVSNLRPLLPGILAWKLKRGDINMTDAIAINYLNGKIYLLGKTGSICQYATSTHPFVHNLGHLNFNKPMHMRAARLSVVENGTTYVVEQRNNRILEINSAKKNVQAFIFPAICNLRGMVTSGDGFWVISRDHLIYVNNKQAVPISAQANLLAIDTRLKGLILPIAGQHLPGHPGVYPGARRLYRYGVHEGLDLFNQPGAKIRVVIGTPVRAACAGKIIRIDSNYKDMNFVEYNRVTRECALTHQTSAKNEDLFRGCQVWIDSGNSLLTKYAHLCKTNNKLHLNDQVKQGDIIGYVGVSGTGENLPGHTPYPHLHFEIWLDGKYLGWGLTPAETMSLFEDVFGSNKR